MNEAESAHEFPVLSADYWPLRLNEQLDMCRDEMGTSREWQPVACLDEDGVSGCIALAHPTNAAEIVRRCNAFPKLVEILHELVLAGHYDCDQARRVRAGMLHSARRVLAECRGEHHEEYGLRQ